jgi:hypothetical protein
LRRAANAARFRLQLAREFPTLVLQLSPGTLAAGIMSGIERSP